MAYLAINGYELPPPKRGVSVIVTTVVDSGRDANGAVVGQRVGSDQYKIDGLEWRWLTAAFSPKYYGQRKLPFLRQNLSHLPAAPAAAASRPALAAPSAATEAWTRGDVFHISR